MQSGAEEVDYRETADITSVHGAIKREHQEPEADMVPVPIWLICLCLVAVFGGGTYLGMFSGGFSGDVFNERDGLSSAGSASAPGAGAGAAKPAEETLAQQGKKVFAANCASCHQPTGLGLPNVYPPLAGSEYVLGSPKRLSMILLKGLQGPVHVKGNLFVGAMPAWATSLNDKKIAAVISYIRSEWGNNAPEVTPEQIAKERAEIAGRSESWTEPDIQAVPADAQIQ